MEIYKLLRVYFIKGMNLKKYRGIYNVYKTESILVRTMCVKLPALCTCAWPCLSQNVQTPDFSDS